MKVLLGFFRSVCSVFALLFCALVLFSPSSAVGAVYTDTVEISSPNAVLSGDIISVNGSDGVRSNYGGGLVGERIISGTKDMQMSLINWLQSAGRKKHMQRYN